MEENVEECLPNKARKRRKAPDTWKRAKAKEERYSAKTAPGVPNCNHSTDDKQFKCKRLTLLDIAHFHDQFYKTKNKKDQDAFILKHCTVTKAKRRRPRVGLRKPTQHITKLFVRKRNSVKLLRVCQKTFVRILNITVQRVRTVSRTFATTGSIVKENRGGDHTSEKNLHKCRSVKQFIESFQCLESHYCRSSVIRKYLPSTLNIRKMWKMYEDQCSEDTKVRECYFRAIFNRCYNLGFGSPRTDTCSKCTQLLEKIKISTDAAEKATLMAEKRLHILKSKAFYRLLKESREDMVVFSFDCQKNQVLPKIPDQAAYYSRQLYIYNFAIVKSVPGNILGKDNVTLYTWTEDEHRKGANEIASAVFDRLQTTIFSPNINTIRLVADGCGAQNKNSIMIGMCATWLSRAPLHIKKIELVFPIPGHSFIPPDRVFGLIEKEIKRMENVIAPEEYISVYKNYGTVVHFDNVLDWKSSLNDVIRPPGNWHFAFAQMKRFYLRRNKSNNVFVQGEANYNANTSCYKSILKKRKSFLEVRPNRINKYKVLIKNEKLRDVNNLLIKHYGSDWKNRSELSYFKQVMIRSEEMRTEEMEEYDEEICEVAIPDSDMRI